MYPRGSLVKIRLVTSPMPLAPHAHSLMWSHHYPSYSGPQFCNQSWLFFLLLHNQCLIYISYKIPFKWASPFSIPMTPPFMWCLFLFNWLLEHLNSSHTCSLCDLQLKPTYSEIIILFKPNYWLFLSDRLHNSLKFEFLRDVRPNSVS